MDAHHSPRLTDRRRRLLLLLMEILCQLIQLLQRRICLEEEYILLAQSRQFGVGPWSIIIASSPAYLRAARIPRVKSTDYWDVVHPNLPDNDGAGSFKAHYRMYRSTFNSLAERLSTHPVYQSTVPNAYPVYIQIACVLWRFSNSHIGYQVMSVQMNISEGSYHNFTTRFLTALIELEMRRVISWPTGERLYSTMGEFQFGVRDNPYRELGPHRVTSRLPNCIGAIDGKLFRIYKLAKSGDRYVDRKYNISLSVITVCDRKKRFTYVCASQSGNSYIRLICYVANFTHDQRRAHR